MKSTPNVVPAAAHLGAVLSRRAEKHREDQEGTCNRSLQNRFSIFCDASELIQFLEVQLDYFSTFRLAELHTPLERRSSGQARIDVLENSL